MLDQIGAALLNVSEELVLFVLMVRREQLADRTELGRASRPIHSINFFQQERGRAIRRRAGRLRGEALRDDRFDSLSEGVPTALVGTSIHQCSQLSVS